MHGFRMIVIPCALIAAVMMGCSIKAPEVQVTGEMTALEKEVVGTYQEMEEDTWMIASTRAARAEREVTISPEKRKVLDALQEQKFNKDDIMEFKRLGFVGEDNKGFLSIRPSKDLENDADWMSLVSEIVQEENVDREVIMERVIELNDALKKSNREEVLAVFAKMNQENSPKGTWVQRSDGGWVRK